MYDTTVVDTCCYTSTLIKGTKLRVDSNVHYGLWWLLCINVSSAIVTNVPLWCLMLIVGEAVHEEWGRGYMETVLSVQFCYEPKTSLENCLFKNLKEIKIIASWG